MASSGTVTYRASANTIINAALRLVGGIDPENTAGPSATQTAGGLEALNMLVKSWETKGLQLWERRWAVVFTQLNQAVYVLGSPGPAGDHACITTPLNGGFVQTTLSTSASSDSSSITVSSVTGQLDTVGNPGIVIASGYYIGIQLDDGTIQWTTVSGSVSGTTVPLTTALTGAASSGNLVYSYQTKLFRPLRILDAFVRQASTVVDTPMRLMSREEYNRFGQKSSAGVPVQWYYDPQTNTGNLYLYPVPQQTTQLIFIEIQKPIDDFGSASEDYDMPQEWGEALKFNLAKRLAPEYEVTKYKYAQISELAKDTFDAINGWDQETASLYLQPDSLK